MYYFISNNTVALVASSLNMCTDKVGRSVGTNKMASRRVEVVDPFEKKDAV